MQSDYLIYDRISGPMIKKSFLRRLMDRMSGGRDDYDLQGALGYLFERQHTGEYIPLDKIKMLMGGSIGQSYTAQMLNCLFCDEEDLPDMILEDPRSIQAEVARARLGMPKPPPAESVSRFSMPQGRSVSHMTPAVNNPLLVIDRNRSSGEVKMPARRAQALADKRKDTFH